MIVSPALLLEHYGGFSEPRFFAMFHPVSRDELERLVRGANATEIRFDGPGAVPMEEIVAPLAVGTFPRNDLDRLASAAYGAIFTVDRIRDPLLQLYCSSLSLYANIVAEVSELNATEWSAAMLYDALKELGWHHRHECVKFFLWCHSLHHGRSGVSGSGASQAVCLVYAYLLALRVAADLGETCIAQMYAGGGGTLQPLASQSSSEEVNGYLTRELQRTLAPDGALALKAKRVLDLATMGVPDQYYASGRGDTPMARRELGGRL